MSTTATATATAVLQFIGLILFSRELAPNRELIALAPRISGHASHKPQPPAIAKTIARREKIETLPEDGNTVEEHAAFIAFPARAYLSSKGWPPSGLETANGYLFVRLDGDHVTFRSERRIASTTIEGEVTEMRRKSLDQPLDLELDTLGLPHLQPCCPGAKLKKEFQAPDYPGAVAVFHLPLLKVKGCHANAKNVNASRIDSRTAIENNGVLVISARKNGQEKTLLVDGNATIVVAYMPIDVITGKRGAGGTARHYQAYYDMIEEGSCSADYHGCAALSEAPQGPCVDESLVRTGAIFLAGDMVPLELQEDLPWLSRTDFECSNTQWP